MSHVIKCGTAEQTEAGTGSKSDQNGKFVQEKGGTGGRVN